MALITVEGVAKSFRIPSERRETVREHLLNLAKPRRFEQLQVLSDVTFALNKGESLGIMGRNGSGKSTLLKIIAGVYLPDRGRVAAAGAITPILELGVGWNPELDAIDNVTLIGSVMGMTLRQIHENMQAILTFAELERFAHLKLKHYSSGMSERLGYAVAFHAVREVLVLDEVFAVGDAGFKQRCEERYRALRRNGHSAIIVSHNPLIVGGFCDRALLLEAGRIIMEGTGAAVAERYLSLLTAAR
jgi:ABC-type polysaccharide/polyol phosphate transport system ATPase subunit